MTKVAVLVGSLREASYTRIVAKQTAALFPSDVETVFVEIGHLPLYNQDYDDKNQVPESYKEFRNTIREMDGVLFATPEYNRSVPAVLKNALDIGSRPYEEEVWDGKPAGVISVSPGAIGGMGANHHLRQALVFVNMPVVQQPEVYIGRVKKLLDEDNNLAPKTLEFLQTFVDAFMDLIRLYSKY